MSEIEVSHPDASASPFDSIKLDGERWSARDLMPLLGYGADWRNFTAAIDRARATAENQGLAFDDLFVAVTEKSGGRPREDFHLARFAVYLIAMNGDPRKPEVAAAQSYFAVKTREAEVGRQFQIPQTMAAALRMAADEHERAELAEAKVAELEPKADLADTYLIAQGGSRIIGQTAKLLGLREKDLRQFLLSQKLVFIRHAPCGTVQWEHYAEFSHHFAAKEHVVNHSHGTCTHYTLTVLPRGIELIRKRMRDAGLSAA